MIPLHDDNPTKIFPFITIIIIVLSVLVFLWQLSLGPANQNAVLAFGVVPAVLFDKATLPAGLDLLPAELTVITSMFLHGGWMHLIGNMLYLWIFGNNIEDSMGHKRFIVFYLLCGIGAAMAQALPNPDSQIPMIGASGAISGVLGAYLLLFPHARVLVVVPLGIIFFTLRIKAGWVLGFWFVFQIGNSLLTASAGGGVAWGAHVGGFVVGMVLIPFFKYRHFPLFAPARGGRH